MPTNPSLTSAEQSNETLLLDAAKDGDLSPRARLEKQFDTDTKSAANRIKAVGTNWISYVASPSKEGREKQDQKSVDHEITRIAQERAKTAKVKIRGYQQAAERRLFDKSVDAKNSLTVLEWKKRVCDEVMTDLQKEIDAKRDLRDRYMEALGEVARLKGKHADVPALKSIEMKRAFVEKVRLDTERHIEARMSDESIDRTKRIHDQLKGFLISVSPGIAVNLDRMLLDNAAGVNTDLIDAIKKLPSIDKKERAMLADLAKHQRLGSFTWANNRAVREFYQAQSNASSDNNPDRVKDRLERLYNKAPIGQGVIIRLGEKRLELGVLRKEGNKVVFVDSTGRQRAAIDITEKKLTVRGPSGEFIHADLDAEKLNPSLDDPSKIHLKATQKSVNMMSTDSVAA